MAVPTLPLDVPARSVKPITLVDDRRRNWLENRFVGGLLRSRWYPGIFAWPTLVVFALIVWQLLFGSTLAWENPGTALTWVLWWPVLPILFVFFGRFWCAICPFATVSDLVQKFAGNQRPVPRFLKRYGIWIIDGVFILITWSDHVFGIVGSPWGSGMLLLALTTGVIVSGAFWERRAWCRYVCFLGGLSANYARTGVLALRTTPQICATCRVAACYRGSEQAAGCPLFVFPKTMESNANCNLCANCVKACPNGSPRLTVRWPTSELWTVRKPRIEEAFLAVVIMGIVFVQNVTMLSIWRTILTALETLAGTTNYAVTFTITFLVAMAIPVLLLGTAALVAHRFNRVPVLENFARFGYAIIPLDVAAHIGHNLFHLLAEGRTIYATLATLFGSPAYGIVPPLVPSPVIQVLQYGLISLGLAASLFAAYRIARQYHPAAAPARLTFAVFAALLVALGAANVYLIMLPMAMRM